MILAHASLRWLSAAVQRPRAGAVRTANIGQITVLYEDSQ